MLLFIEQRGGVLRVRISAGCDESLKELGAEIELTGNFPKDTAARELFSLAIRECTSNCIRHADRHGKKQRIYGSRDACAALSGTGDVLYGDSGNARHRRADGQISCQQYAPEFEKNHRQIGGDFSFDHNHTTDGRSS